jgi:ribosomal protein L11 methyltransferase
VEPKELGSEILVAELGEKPFESFVETDLGVIAYIKKEDWQEDILEDVFVLKSPEFTIKYHVEEIEPVNWNEEWEQNFSPIEVDDRCYIRAPFHEPKNVPFEIVIEPKMSFGTGHHETTFLMIQQLLDTNLEGKSTLDMGCGTAILAILAAKKGANPVDAVDIDPWCYENSLENVSKNDCAHIKVFQGDASWLTNQKYDVIIANINRNILLEDIPTYVTCLNDKGLLFLSGFYSEDISYISKCCENQGLQPVKTTEKNNWIAMQWIKN